MIVEPLLPLHRTPDLHAVLDEPFYNEWCFIIPSSEPVKHEHKQNIKFAERSIMLNFLNGVAVFGGYLVAGNAFFRKFLDNHPALLFCEVTANLFLHRNIAPCCTRPGQPFHVQKPADRECPPVYGLIT